jgi:plastocyanin
MLLNLALLATGITGVYSQATHTVQVGPTGALIYDPPTVSAAVGDIVRYCL